MNRGEKSGHPNFTASSSHLMSEKGPQMGPWNICFDCETYFLVRDVFFLVKNIFIFSRTNACFGSFQQLPPFGT